MSCLGPFKHAKTIGCFLSRARPIDSSPKRGILSCDTCPLIFVKLSYLHKASNDNRGGKLVFILCWNHNWREHIYVLFLCWAKVLHKRFASLHIFCKPINPYPFVHVYGFFIGMEHTHIKSLQNFKFVHYLVYLCIYVKDLFLYKINPYWLQYRLLRLLLHPVYHLPGCTSLLPVGRQIVPEQCIPNIFSWTTGGSFRRIRHSLVRFV